MLNDNSYIANYATLKITVSLDNNTKLGKLGIIIIDKEDNLKNFKPYRDGVHQIYLSSTSYSWVYYGLPKGNYAIGAAQDLNNNRKLDYEIEKYAFSRDVQAVNGNINSFDSCKTDIKESFCQIIIHCDRFALHNL